MKPLENQIVTIKQTTIVTKVTILILNALCGVTIYCLLKLAGIRPADADVFNMLAGIFGAIMIITWLAWPAKR